MEYFKLNGNSIICRIYGVYKIKIDTGDTNITKDKKYGEVHAGSMYENASLYCASAGLQCVVRAWYDRAELKEALGLEGDLEVVMTLAAGYPPVTD